MIPIGLIKFEVELFKGRVTCTVHTWNKILIISINKINNMNYKQNFCFLMLSSLLLRFI